jgi:hypothetical protein
VTQSPEEGGMSQMNEIWSAAILAAARCKRVGQCGDARALKSRAFGCGRDVRAPIASSVHWQSLFSTRGVRTDSWPFHFFQRLVLPHSERP